jgi:hypothetical protein
MTATEAAVEAPKPELETSLAAVERRLSARAEAVERHDSAAVENEAAALHRVLAAAIRHFTLAARSNGVPPVLRRRLAAVSGQVAVQRDAMARATASLDRAIDALLPGQGGVAAAVYTAAGTTERGVGAGSIEA